MLNRLLLSAVGAAFATSASATLLFYEPFNYADAALNGNGGALGASGTWTTTDTGFGSGWWNHPGGSTTGQFVDATNQNVFNGNYGNLPSTGGFAGMAAPGDRGLAPNTDGGTGNLDGSIGLSSAVTSSFVGGNTTWFSWVSAYAWDRNQGAPQVMISNASSSGGSRGLTMGGGDGVGGGSGPSRFNLFDIYPQYFEGGVNNHAPGGYDYPSLPTSPWQVPADARGDGTPGTNDGEQREFGSGNNNTARGTLLDNFQVGTTINGTTITQDMVPVFDQAAIDSGGGFGDYSVVVMKIEWDADTGGEDIISLVAFDSDEVISEANFDAKILAQPLASSANWVGKDEQVTSVYQESLGNTGQLYQVTYDANKPDLDQSTFDRINIQSLKFYVDEIRIGTEFADMLAVPEPSSLALIGIGGLLIARRRRG